MWILVFSECEHLDIPGAIYLIPCQEAGRLQFIQCRIDVKVVGREEIHLDPLRLVFQATFTIG
jgi:hypothetical protein